MPSTLSSLDQLGDLLDEPGLVHLVGNLGDDDRLPVALASTPRSRPGRGCMIPRPVRVGLAIPRRPRMMPRGGEVGAGEQLHELLERSSRGSRSEEISARRTTSPRLWGGMLVAMPTAMPEAPLTRRFGKTGRAGPSGSLERAVVVGARSRPCPCRCPPASLAPAGSGGPRCSAWPRGGRRRWSRSSPGRPPGGSACEKSWAMRTRVS